VALSAVQLSFMLGGVELLDFCALLLVPAFVLFLMSLLMDFKNETWDYRWSLVLLILCLALSFVFRSKFEVATIDDNYHVKRTVGFSFKNNFSSQWIMPYEIDKGHVSEPDERLLYSGYIESVWGIFWRYIRWDFVIVLLQGLPIVVLWHELMHFFRRKNVIPAGLLSLAVIFSLQVLWVQQCSGYIDSTAGILGGLVLLGIYDLFSKARGPVSWYRVLGLAVVSGLCLVSKLILWPIGLTGAVVALWAAHQLSKTKLMIIVLLGLLAAGYLGAHFIGVHAVSGQPFYPFGVGKSAIFSGRPEGSGFDGPLRTFYKANPLNVKLHEKNIDVPALYVLSSWVMDYKYRLWVTPDPWVGGRGVLWTFMVLPVLGLAFLGWIKRPKENLYNPRIMIFGLLAFYVLFFDGAILSRYVLALEIFIMAWALAWVWSNLKPKLAAAWVVLLLASVNFYGALDGDILQKRHYPKSFLDSTEKMFIDFTYDPASLGKK
jgi:hypothetical protein